MWLKPECGIEGADTVSLSFFSSKLLLWLHSWLSWPNKVRCHRTCPWNMLPASYVRYYHVYAACFCCGTSTKALPGVVKEAVYWKVQEGFVRVKTEWKVHTKLSSKRETEDLQLHAVSPMRHSLHHSTLVVICRVCKFTFTGLNISFSEFNSTGVRCLVPFLESIGDWQWQNGNDLMDHPRFFLLKTWIILCWHWPCAIVLYGLTESKMPNQRLLSLFL